MPQDLTEWQFKAWGGGVLKLGAIVEGTINLTRINWILQISLCVCVWVASGSTRFEYVWGKPLYKPGGFSLPVKMLSSSSNEVISASSSVLPIDRQVTNSSRPISQKISVESEGMTMWQGRRLKCVNCSSVYIKGASMLLRCLLWWVLSYFDSCVNIRSRRTVIA